MMPTKPASLASSFFGAFLYIVSTISTSMSSGDAYASFRKDPRQTEAGVMANMNYVTPDTMHPFTRRDLAGTDQGLEGATWLPTNVNIRNARVESKTLARNGFQLVSSAMSGAAIDFYDQSNVVQRYYPICQELVQHHLENEHGGRVRVYAFDHNVRSNNNAPKELKESKGAMVQKPAAMVHADYTGVSAPNRLRQLGQPPKANDVYRLTQGQSSLLDPKMIEEALDGRRRFAFVNVWRNINPTTPVQQFPLACMDANSVSMDDLRTYKIYYEDRVGENYFCCPSLQHQWWFYPEMVHDEALLLKQWDSHGDIAKGAARDDQHSSFTVHSAFDYETNLSDIPRESIEVRCVAIWEDPEP